MLGLLVSAGDKDKIIVSVLRVGLGLVININAG